MPQSLLVANPIDRYLTNSPMLAQLQRDAKGQGRLTVTHKTTPISEP
jgi:hypothetical protein